MFGIIGFGIYFLRLAIRMSQYRILTEPNETILPSATQSCSRQYEIGFFFLSAICSLFASVGGMDSGK
jgi:hypothetical protein